MPSVFIWCVMIKIKNMETSLVNFHNTFHWKMNLLILFHKMKETFVKASHSSNAKGNWIIQFVFKSKTRYQFLLVRKINKTKTLVRKVNQVKKKSLGLILKAFSRRFRFCMKTYIYLCVVQIDKLEMFVLANLVCACFPASLFFNWWRVVWLAIALRKFLTFCKKQVLCSFKIVLITKRICPANTESTVKRQKRQ